MAPFGETVLAWRLTRGMTQAQLARAARPPGVRERERAHFFLKGSLEPGALASLLKRVAGKMLNS